MAWLDEWSEFTFEDVEKAVEVMKKTVANRPKVYYLAGVDCFIDADTGKEVKGE